MILRSTMFPSGSGSLSSTRSLVNSFLVNGYTGIVINSMSSLGAVSVASGAMTSGVAKNFLNISGVGGKIYHLSVRTTDATARTIRVRCVVDGVEIFNVLTASISANGVGILIAGVLSSTSSVILPPISWRSTLVFEVTSSVTETDKLIIERLYSTEA